MSRKVLILGSGPEALAVAALARQYNVDVSLVSKRGFAPIVRGPRFIFPTPALPTLGYPAIGQKVQFSAHPGDIDGEEDAEFARRVIDEFAMEDFDLKIPNLTGEPVVVIDLRYFCGIWWHELVGEKVSLVPGEFTARTLIRSGPKLQEDFDLVISTIPAEEICARPGEHAFKSYTLHTKTLLRPGDTTPVGSIRYNGNSEPAWVRQSRALGVETKEWTGRKPPIDGVISVKHPIWSSCDCFPWIHKLGARGAWRVGIEVHDVIEQADVLLARLTGGKPRVRRPDVCKSCMKISIRERRQLHDGSIEYVCPEGHRWDVDAITVWSSRHKGER